jgi:hypothetical protein
MSDATMVRSSARQAGIRDKLEEAKRIENEKKRKHELSQKWSILHNILESGTVRIYPFPQTWQSNLEKKYIATKTPKEQYDLIRQYFEVFSTTEFDCNILQDAYSGQPTSDLTYYIGHSLKVSMFLYLTIFNIHYRNSHKQEILKPDDNQDDLIKLLCILECFIKILYNSVTIEGNSEEAIKLLWQKGMPYLDIEGLKTVINTQLNVSEKVKTQFSYLLELTEIFFGKAAVKINTGKMMQEAMISASPIFQHLMKDNKKLIVLLFDLLKNNSYDEQRLSHKGTYLRPAGISRLVADDFIYSLIYSPIFRLTILFSKYLKTGNLNFLSSAIPPRLVNIGDLYNLLVEIENNIGGKNSENSTGEEGNQDSFLTKIKTLITTYNSINSDIQADRMREDSDDFLRKLSQWLFELDDLVYNSDEFQRYLDIQQQPGVRAFKQQRSVGGGKKNKELEKEIKKISRNALKISKKKELIKEKIKKIDNKLKELDNKKKELGKIYKIKKNKVLKDKIDKTIKNINKEKVNKSDKKKELKKTSNEYKKIDKALKKLKIKNKK